MACNQMQVVVIAVLSGISLGTIIVLGLLIREMIKGRLVFK